MTHVPPAHSGLRVAQHILLNLLGQGLPALAGLATVPLMVHGLGTAGYGAFSLAWVLLGYFSLVDLGLGRATTRFVAEYAALGKLGTLRQLVRTALRVQVMLGLAGAVVLALLVPWLTRHALRVPDALLPSVTTGFFLMAASLPLLLLSANLSGVLEGLRRFDVLNGLRIPASLAVFALPAIAVSFGAGFVGAVIALVAARMLGLIGFALAVSRLLPPRMETPAAPDRTLIGALIGFGGWLTVSNLVSPLMVYLDRFVIGSRLDLAAVSYYSAPYDVISRLLLIPSSLVSVLFPEFIAHTATQGTGASVPLILRSARALLGVMGLVIVILLPLTGAALHLWLGPAFAAAATAASRFLLVGVLVNAVAWIPFAYLQGAGRPDLPAKAHLVEVPLYLVLLWLLTSRMGITGAGVAWFLRALLDLALLLTFTVRVGGTSVLELVRKLSPGLVISVLSGIAGILIAGRRPELWTATAGAATGATMFVVGWAYVLQPEERRALTRLCVAVRSRAAPGGSS